MMNTFLAKLFGTKNNTINSTPSLVNVPTQVRSKLYDKYYQYYLECEFSHEDADLIASLFENSTMNAEHNFYSLNEIEKKGDLSLHCSASEVSIYCHNSNGEVVECHNIPLETAIMLHYQNIVRFERHSRHFLEYFWLV